MLKSIMKKIAVFLVLLFVVHLAFANGITPYGGLTERLPFAKNLTANPSNGLILGGGSGSGLTKFANSTCSFPLPLGSNTTAAAYSFRKLSSNYAGNAVRLLRASDSTTKDIGFANCNFDSATAATFCAATTCTIQTWYDQGGGGANATQAVAISQPTYTANCDGSLPCATFTSSILTLSATLASSVGNNTYAAVASFTTSAATGAIADIGNAVVDGTSMGFSTSSGACFDQRSISSVNDKATGTCSINTIYRWIGTNNTNLSRIFINGTQGTDSATVGTIVVSTSLVIGGVTAAANPWAGNIEELIIFAPDISTADSNTISLNQKTYWSTSG